MADGSVVPEVIARMGIYLHWVVDRASHWYCADAPASGITIVRSKSSPNTKYDSYVYADPSSCNFMVHGETHFWEQGMNGTVAPGTFVGLKMIYDTLQGFRNKFLGTQPGWFKNSTAILAESDVVGTYEKPGILMKINQIADGKQRFTSLVNELKTRGLPAMPGFELLDIRLIQ